MPDTATERVRLEGDRLHVGHVRYPVRGSDVEDLISDAYDFRTRRARLTFENGWLLSVVWGTGTYGDNHHAGFQSRGEFQEEPSTVEIAVRRGDDGPLVGWSDGDTVQGWVTAPELRALVAYMNGWPSEGDFTPTLDWREKGTSG